MPFLGQRMRRYVNCGCWTSASEGGGLSPSCDDFHCTTCGPLARRRCDRMLDYDVEAWLENVSTTADCDLSRSLSEKNDEVFCRPILSILAPSTLLLNVASNLFNFLNLKTFLSRIDI